MAQWFRASRSRGGKKAKDGPEDLVFELLVLEGEDAGQRFTVDGNVVSIHRGKPSASVPGEIVLTDPTVSSRQATIRQTSEGLFIEHREEATNSTSVNGREISIERIRAGDRISMGRTVLEVRSRPGISLTELIQKVDPADVQRADPGVTRSWPNRNDRTEIRRTVEPPKAWLTIASGVEGWEGRQFDVGPKRTSIGRNEANEICIPEQGVSRQHADLVWEGDDLVLIHKSETNPTRVNGQGVEDRRVLRNGDEIRLADRVALKLELGGLGSQPEATEAPAPDTDALGQPRDRAASLRAAMEEKIRRDRAIEEEYGFVGSFLDIDVVDSYGLKVNADRPEHIILSFERFRMFAEEVVNEFDGQVLNSNGDELMCFFDSPLQAVRCASTVIARLQTFNAEENLLGRPFRLRQGVHTGNTLVDRQRGVAYSPVLDVAGHLQKHADHDGLLISEDTFQALPEGLPFESAGELENEGIPTYRLSGAVE